MAITSKVNICNLALGHLGNYGTVSDIDSPTNDKERTFSLWYDISRQTLLKMTMPNFALARRLVGELVATIPFGYTYAYEYPIDCLKVLGIGDVDETGTYIYSVEQKPDGSGMAIFTDQQWEDGLELRFIKDVEVVNVMSPEFKMLLADYLAMNVCLPITQDPVKAQKMAAEFPTKLASASGLNAQENKPIRISRSLFKAARYSDVSRIPEKK